MGAVRDVRRRRSSRALLLIDLDRMDLVDATLGRDWAPVLAKPPHLWRALSVPAQCSRARVRRLRRLRRVTDPAAALKQAALLLEACGEPYVVECVAAIVTVSIGIALHPRDADDPASLLARAERALYQAKVRGRDRFYPGFPR